MSEGTLSKCDFFENPSYNMSSFHFLNKTQPPQVTSLHLPANLSCVLLKKQTISVESKPLPVLQPDGVLVKIISTDRSSWIRKCMRK